MDKPKRPHKQEAFEELHRRVLAGDGTITALAKELDVTPSGYNLWKKRQPATRRKPTPAILPVPLNPPTHAPNHTPRMVMVFGSPAQIAEMLGAFNG